MQKEIKQIAEILKSGAVIAPDVLAGYLRVLAGLYAFWSDSFINQEIIKNTFISAMRKDVKTDIEAKRLFIQTKDGKQYIKTRVELKMIEKMMSAIKSSITVERKNWQSSNY